MFAGKILKEFEVEGEKAKIRYESMSDAEDIKRLRNSLVEEEAKIGWQEKADLDETIEKVGDALKDIEKGEGIYLVLEIGGKVVGSVIVEKGGPGAQEPVGTSGIFLRKEMRGKNLGTKLMETVVSEAKERLDIESIVLEAFEDNKPAINLYKKVGFEVVGRIEKGLRDPEGKLKDRLILQKKLE